uniref:Tumor necrosis factor receptor superfamily member 19L n=1 Tax=Geotrypetes seraphini TaxID=260995 RepID=A0A6P8QZ02_GEOSA|nr:tumor necrosis factor receptor superfamily member 19L [Geotrypetes seraphini]XP_033803306.1 tumor necrosis factor receptor superfamily member 19L [Geotrypetes seraphini]XP_033803307.1 tumor necrosis factor receptor superfamily member 19L [Geotrypetes seraphini]
MSLSPECLWLTCLVMMLSWQEALLLCGEWEYVAEDGQCAPCAECPRGEEPDRKCGFGKGLGVTCRPCLSNMFSESYGTEPCMPRTHCVNIYRIQLSFGTATADNQCGNCMQGFFAPKGDFDNASECLPCFVAPKNTPECKGDRNPHARSKRTIDSALRRESIVVLNRTLASSEESRTDYAVLAIVPVFCMMGLLGILLCNLLKKKGYHCTSQKELDEESAAGEKHMNNFPFRADEANEDTIGVLVRLITEKKENAFALEELLKDYHSKQIAPATKTAAKKSYLLPPLPHVCRHQHHLHTVQGPAPRSGSCCTRCSQKKWPEVLLSPEMAAVAALPSKPVRAGPKPGRPGEITILSVGRFRVARIPEQKTNPCEVKTVLEPGGDGPDSPCSSPTEQKTLLGAGTKAKWPKATDNKPEVVN